MNSLKNCRERANLKICEVASTLDVLPNSVWRWEKGEREPGIENLKRLAQLYKCTLDDLVNNLPTQPPRAAGDEITATA